jgi:hypothetical protein
MTQTVHIPSVPEQGDRVRTARPAMLGKCLVDANQEELSAMAASPSPQAYLRQVRVADGFRMARRVAALVRKGRDTA